MLIVYGVIAQQSISRMFVAGILPGVVIIALFMIYVMIRATLDPSLAPRSEERPTLREKLRASRLLIPVLLLIIPVIGSIYCGLATPTAAATIGVVGALMPAWWRSEVHTSDIQSLMRISYP